jgi:hypothetical protein
VKYLLAAEAAITAAVLWLVTIAHQPGQFAFLDLGVYLMQATGLAIAVGAVAGMVAVGVLRRGVAPEVMAGLGALGATVVVAGGRLLDVTDAAEAVAAAAWLGGAGVVLSLLAVSSTVRADPAGVPTWIVVGAATAAGIAAGVVGVGPHLDGVAHDRPAADSLLVAHLALLVVAYVAIVDLRRPARQLMGDPVFLASLLWLGCATAERVVHLLPFESYWELQRGGYQTWAVVVAMFAPLLATGGVVVALGWTLGVRPHAQRLASGLLVVPDRDPVAALRDDLADWTGDPTIRLAFSDGSGRWLEDWAVGDVANHRYDRAATTVTRQDRPIALIEHDISLTHAPEALRTAAELAGVAFDATQLMALSEARVVEARGVGERLLVADATTREELLAELECGAIARLEGCAAAIDFGASLHEVAESLREVTTEVRAVSHGLYPPELIDHGLSAVLPGHPGAPARRLPPAVEITVFLLASEDPHSTMNDDGAIVWVHRKNPVTDNSLIDRIEVLGGSIIGTSVCLPVEGG